MTPDETGSPTAARSIQRFARRRSLWWPSLLGAVVIAMLIMAFAGAHPSATHAATPCGGNVMAADRQALPGHLIPALRTVTPLHPADCNQVLHLVIALKLRDQAGLDALLAAQNDPKSPEFHHYLSPAEFTARFGPTQASVDAVASFLRSQGLQVDSVAANHMLIDVTATVAEAQRAFGVTIANYTFNGRTVYAPTADPTVPTALAATIQGIGGLDDVAQFHPLG